MKTTYTITKLLFIIPLLIIVIACRAQNTLSTLSDGQTAKGITQWYKAKKLGKYVGVENTQNRFTDIKQSSPNLPINLTPSKFDIIIDKGSLLKLCAKYITLQQLQAMAPIKNAGLMIIIRTNIQGSIIEVGFFTEQNSLLGLQQLEQLENNIKTIPDLIIIKPAIQKYLQGSNFWLVNEKFYYDDVLKVKQEMEAASSIRTKDPRRL